MIRVMPVSLEYVHHTWGKVNDYIADALQTIEGVPDYTLDHVLGYLASGRWELVVAVDDDLSLKGAATIEFINYPLHRAAMITTIGGNLITNKDTFEQLKQYLRQRGATKVQGYGRPSIVRLWKQYDVHPVTTLMEAVL